MAMAVHHLSLEGVHAIERHLPIAPFHHVAAYE